MLLLDLRRDLGHVLARIRVLRDLDLFAEELPVADRNGLAEARDLRAAVLDVVLALHVGAREPQHGREHVPQRAAARVRERERAGRVGGDELDLDAFPLQRLRAAVVRAVGDDRVDLSAQPGDIEADVHETVAGHLGRRERRAEIELILDRAGDLARRPAQRPRETHRDARRVVAVLGVGRDLDLDRLPLPALPAVLARGARERLRKCGGHEVARGSGHARESGAGITTAPTSPLGTCWRKKMRISAAAAV